MLKLRSGLLLLTITFTAGQRLLWPVNEYDMSMSDAAELCVQIDKDKGKTDTTREQYLPPPDKCYFYQFIYCPDVPANADFPCGWWAMKPCNTSMFNREPHYVPKKANPDTRVGLAPVFVIEGRGADSCKPDECPAKPCPNGWFCLNCKCTPRYV